MKTLIEKYKEKLRSVEKGIYLTPDNGLINAVEAANDVKELLEEVISNLKKIMDDNVQILKEVSDVYDNLILGNSKIAYDYLARIMDKLNANIEK